MRLSRLAFIAILLLCVGLSAGQGKKPTSFAGHWTWKSQKNKQKEHVQFSLNVVQKGKNVTGTYSVDHFIDGQWQGEDGNQTPFRGTLRSNTATVEFNIDAAVAGYEQNVKYVVPSARKDISFATLKLAKGRLVWTHKSGRRVEGILRTVTLKRD